MGALNALSHRGEPHEGCGMKTSRFACCGIAVLMLAACSGESGKTSVPSAPAAPNAPAAPGSPAVTPLPVGKEFQVSQRATYAFPETDEAVSLTLDDITRGQVIVTLTHRNSPNLVGPVSMREGHSQPVDYAGQRTWLWLKRLDNALIGNDTATFVIKSEKPGLTELLKIEKLLERVEKGGATFVRSGKEFSAAAAANHLERKFNTLYTPELTAAEFITQGASVSSETGETYEVVLPGGQRQPLGDWLREELKKIEAADKNPGPDSPAAE